ncbi:hypothetical protein G9C98_002462 [Cotesia typhae]|uniref:SKP1 component dimerisation domain-containing protein n=2 Tax=Cotesia typhae TaxID=2053667 RepID=A0A8J5QX63_9HYME|nr:hypothetical protein G9C98_002462 [Cotesia typhae]
MDRRRGDFVTIRCSDGEIRTRRSALQPYRTLYGARSAFSGSLNEIRLPHLPTSVARQIVSWAERHMNDPNRTAFEAVETVDVTLTPEDSNQLSTLDINTLLQVIQASDEYNVLDLLSGACQIAARVFENSDPMNLRRDLFNGESGFTEEEEERLRKETEWMEEL